MFKNNKQSYSGHRTEHKFGQRSEIQKQNKESTTKNQNLINNSEIKEKNQIIKKLRNDCAKKEKELCDEKERNKKYRRRENRTIVLGAAILFTLFISFLLEYPFSNSSAGYSTMVVGRGGGIISILIELLLCMKNVEKGGCEGIIELFKIFKEKFPRNGALHLVMLSMLVLTLGGAAANVNLIHRSIVFCKIGYYAFINYDEMGNLGMLADGGIVEGKEMLAEINKIQIGQLNKDMQQMMPQKAGEMRLSTQDWNLVFFHGENNINGIEEQGQINNIVLAMVEELISHDLENVFDKPSEQGGAPQSVKNQISNISDNENNAKSFEEVNEILDYREGMNEKYPKKSLTQLVANGYENLGNILYESNGNKTDIIFYYGQSIINNLKCLEFAENTNKTIKEKLTDIVRIYNSIAFTCPNCEEAKIALDLAEAFQHAADQY